VKKVVNFVKKKRKNAPPNKILATPMDSILPITASRVLSVRQIKPSLRYISSASWERFTRIPSTHLHLGVAPLKGVGTNK